MNGRRSRDPSWTGAFVVAMILFLGLWLGGLLEPILAWVTAMSSVSLVLYAIDKANSGRGAYRVPESLLLSGAVLGGGPGALIGMVLLRHKTRKTSFRAINTVSTAVWTFLCLVSFM